MATATKFLTLESGKQELRSLDADALSPPTEAEASEALGIGDLVNIYDDTGTIKARKADASLDRPAVGVLKAAFTLGQTVSIYKDALLTDTGLTPSACLFLSATTPGAYTETAATQTNGYINQIVGRTLSDVDVCIHIEQDYTLYNF